MSDSDQDEYETAPRFNKGILGRILAVTIFVALGTFAVIHSMGRGTGQNVADKAKAGLEEAKGTVENTAEKIGEGVSRTASDLKSATNNALQNTANMFTSKKMPGDSVPKIKPTAELSDSKFKPALPNFGTTAPPNKTVVNSAVKKTPPQRFAQAPTGTPIIGNQSGIGLRKPPVIPSTTVPVKTSFNPNPIVGKFGDAAGDLKSKAGAAADDLLKKASDKANAAGNSIKTGLRNFGANTGLTPNTNANPPIVQSKTPPRTFTPPSVNTNFGQAKSGTNNFGQTSRPPSTFGASGKLAPINSNPRAFNPNRSKAASDFGGQVFEPNTNSARPTTNAATTQNSFPPIRAKGASSFPPAKPTIPAQAVSSISPNRPANRPANRLGSTFGGASNPLTKNLPGDRQYEGLQAPALTVEKLSPREIQVKQPADFQLVIKNVGRAGAEEVQVFDQIPNGTEFISASPEPDVNSGGKLQWNLGKLRPGQEKRIKIKLRPIRHGEIGSVAHVAFATKASMRTLVTKPVLEIVHQSKPIHLIGDDVVFDITVKNKGDGPATNVLIQEDVPQQLEFQDGSPGIEYEIGTLMPGQSRRVQLALKAASIGKLRNVMFASADGGLEARHEIPMEVVAPNLVTKSNGPTIRFLNRNVSHAFSVLNNGTAKATNVELIARLPSGLRFVSANNQGRYDSNAHSVFWSLAELGRDIKADVELKTSPVEVGDQPIKFETFADLEVNSSVVQPLKVQHLVDVFFDIDDVVDPIEVGSDTSYRVRVVNQGTKAATNVRLQVDFPRGLQPTSIDGSLKHQISGSRILFEPINSMSPGDEISFVINGKGQSEGDHRVVVNMQTDGRQTPVSKEETTRVYSDR